MGIRIAITDDHMLVTESLEQAIKATGYMEVSGRYHSGEALMQGLKAEQPDVLLLDYHLPDTNGSQLARYVTYHYPDVRILVLTGHEEPGLAAELLECGCMGYMQKGTATTAAIVAAIERVSEGYVFLDQAVREKYVRFVHRSNRAEGAARPRLTQREIEILRCIAAEMSSQEIADKLCLSKKTVDNHRNSMMVKTGAKNAAGLVRIGYELKLL